MADISEYREAPPRPLAADIRFYDPKSKELGRTVIKPFAASKQTASFPLDRLPVGRTLVRATLSRSNGDKVASSETAFTKLAAGPWRNNSLGLDDIVIDPFEPIRVDGQRIHVWNQ